MSIRAPRPASLGAAAFQAAEIAPSGAGAFQTVSQAAQGSALAAARTPRWVGWVFGVFLAYNVGRLPEVFPSFDVPRLPLILAGLIVPIVLANTPTRTWKIYWQSSAIFRALVGILILAVVTIPIGIWAGGSFWFFRTRFIVQWISFACGMVLFRDRVMLRRALAVLILAVGAAAIDLLLPGLTPTALTAALENEPLHSIFDNTALALLVFVPLAVAMLAGLVGIFLLKEWGRALSLYSTVLGFGLYPFLGASVSSSWSSALSEASTMLWGAVLAIAYFFFLEGRFSVAQSRER